MINLILAWPWYVWAGIAVLVVAAGVGISFVFTMLTTAEDGEGGLRGMK